MHIFVLIPWKCSDISVMQAPGDLKILSLLFGSWERWGNVQMLGTTSREAWEKQGYALRAAWISFVRDFSYFCEVLG